jgi:hypothetical protein
MVAAMRPEVLAPGVAEEAVEVLIQWPPISPVRIPTPNIEMAEI